MHTRALAVALLTSLTSAAQAQVTPTENVVTAPAVEVEGTRLPAASPHSTAIRPDSNGADGVGVAGLAAEFAGLHLADAGARSFTNTLSLRGLTNTPLFGDPSVVMYLDEVPLGGAFTFPTDLVGFESAELFRGLAHNTRFGRAGTAGVLQVRTPAAFSGTDARVSYGSDQARAAVVRTALGGDELDVYIAAGYRARDGYIVNQTLGTDIDWRESSSALARLRYRPREGTEWVLLAALQRVRDGVQPLVPLQGPYFEVNRSGEGTTPLDTQLVSLHGRFDLGRSTFSSTTSFTHWDLGPAGNVLGLGFAELANDTELSQRVFSEELRLVSSDGAARPWSLILHGSDGEAEGAFTRSIFGQTFEQSAFSITHRSLSLAGEYGFPLSPALRLTVGARAEGNWKELERTEYVPGSRRFDREGDSSALLPRAELTYAATASWQAAIGVGSSYKPGGFSAFTGREDLAAFGPERARGLDASLTHRSADGAFAATLRAFAYRVSGYQIERSFQTGGMSDDYLVVNAGRARSVGTELELAWKPAQGLTVAGSAGLARATLRSFRDPYTGESYDGRRAPYVPSHDLSARIEYRLPSGWYARATYTRVGRTYYTEAEADVFAQRAYGLIGARLGWVGERVEVVLYGDNLEDRAYYSAIIPGTFHGTPGAPRSYGVEVQLRF